MAETTSAVTRIGGKGLARFISVVAGTSRAIYEPDDLMQRLRAGHPLIMAGWHGQFMMLSRLDPGDVKVAAMVARHGDAELIAQAMQALGVTLIRGAGAGGRKRDRGGAAALRTAVKALKDDYSLVMTADVPPGPARVAGLGIITIAAMSGCPIYPVAIATSKMMSFDTWSRLTINLPFSKIAFVGGAPVHVPRDADAETMESLRKTLENELNRATERAYALAGADLKRAIPLSTLAAQSPPPPNTSLRLYRAGLSMLRPAVPLLLSMRERRGKEDAARRGERLGFAGRPRPQGRLVWVHAASVGETNAILPVIESILAYDRHAHVLLTTGTTTSAALASKRLPERAMHQFVPLDVPQYIDRFFDHWRPDLAIFTESDIWPNLILGAGERSIPLALVNARMSPRSMKRWRKNARVGRPLFSRFNVVLAQNAMIAKTISSLGAPNVSVAGNLKIDAPPPPVDGEALQQLRVTTAGRPILLAASTHPGEEAIIASAHQLIAKSFPKLLTIIVPRHPERGPALLADMAGRGLVSERRSLTRLPSAKAQIFIADTLGELGTFYALAPISLIGGSLIEHGGQNPIEAVRHQSAVLTGPYMHNFRDIYQALFDSDGAREVKNADELAGTVIELLQNPPSRVALSNGGSVALDVLGGALAKTMAALTPFLGAGSE